MKHKDTVIHNVTRHCINSSYFKEGKVREFENMLILYGVMKREHQNNVIHHALRKLELLAIMCTPNIQYKKSIKIDKDEIIVKYIIFEGV